MTNNFQQPGLPWTSTSASQPGFFDLGAKNGKQVTLANKIDVETRWSLIPLVLTWFISSFIITLINELIYSKAENSGYESHFYDRFTNLEISFPWKMQGTLVFLWTASAFLMWIPNVEKFYARYVMKMRRPLDREAEILEPALADVLQSAGISNHPFELWVEDSDTDNAYASGRNIICVTRGALIRETPEQLRGTIAHELGHHLGWHTRVLSLQCWYLIPIELLCRIPILRYLFSPIFNGILSLMSALGRPQEFRADLTAVHLGHGEGLIDYFYGELNKGADDRRRFSSLMARATATHPSIPERIAAMEAAMKIRNTPINPPPSNGQWQPNGTF